MRTLIKILDKIGEHMVGVGWWYGAPVYRRPQYYSRLRQEDR